MAVSRYFVWFVLFSFMGWLYETIYAMIKKRRWENRGFLFGPICPIYGVGAVSAAILCTGTGLPKLTNWQIFILSFLGSIVLEYGTSYVLEKLFHAVWWDYSDVFCNIHGRICLPASIGFGFAGLLVVNVIVPFTERLTNAISPIWMESIAMILVAVVSADFALTVSSLTSLTQYLVTMEDQINQQMQSLYSAVGTDLSAKKEEATRTAAKAISHLLGFGEKHALHSIKAFRYSDYKLKISSYLIKFEQEIKDRMQNINKRRK